MRLWQNPSLEVILRSMVLEATSSSKIPTRIFTSVPLPFAGKDLPLKIRVAFEAVQRCRILYGSDDSSFHNLRSEETNDIDVSEDPSCCQNKYRISIEHCMGRPHCSC